MRPEVLRCLASDRRWWSIAELADRLDREPGDLAAALYYLAAHDVVQTKGDTVRLMSHTNIDSLCRLFAD